MLRMYHEQTFTNFYNTCLNLTKKEWLHRCFEDILYDVDENEILQRWEESVSVCEEKELVAMYRLKLYCRDWRETDMKTSAWKSKMMRMTSQLMHLQERL